MSIRFTALLRPVSIALFAIIMAALLFVPGDAWSMQSANLQENPWLAYKGSPDLPRGLTTATGEGFDVIVPDLVAFPQDGKLFSVGYRGAKNLGRARILLLDQGSYSVSRDSYFKIAQKSNFTDSVDRYNYGSGYYDLLVNITEHGRTYQKEYLDVKSGQLLALQFEKDFEVSHEVGSCGSFSQPLVYKTPAMYRGLDRTLPELLLPARTSCKNYSYTAAYVPHGECLNITVETYNWEYVEQAVRNNDAICYSVTNPSQTDLEAVVEFRQDEARVQSENIMLYDDTPGIGSRMFNICCDADIEWTPILSLSNSMTITLVSDESTTRTQSFYVRGSSADAAMEGYYDFLRSLSSWSTWDIIKSIPNWKLVLAGLLIVSALSFISWIYKRFKNRNAPQATETATVILDMALDEQTNTVPSVAGPTPNVGGATACTTSTTDGTATELATLMPSAADEKGGPHHWNLPESRSTEPSAPFLPSGTTHYNPRAGPSVAAGAPPVTYRAGMGTSAGPPVTYAASDDTPSVPPPSYDEYVKNL